MAQTNSSIERGSVMENNFGLAEIMAFLADNNDDY